MRVAPSVELTDEQRQTLEQWARGRSLPARQVERARIVLLAANGELDVAIAAKLGITNQKAARWRARFLALGLSGLEKDAPRPGRTPYPVLPSESGDQRTTQERPSHATHWSTRMMAAEVASAKPACGAFGRPMV
jgi:hypothetical protein